MPDRLRGWDAWIMEQAVKRIAGGWRHIGSGPKGEPRGRLGALSDGGAVGKAEEDEGGRCLGYRDSSRDRRRDHRRYHCKHC
jgi:hypothetical protein